MTLTANKAREFLDYDRETGAFKWRVSRGKAKVGLPAGAINKMGYLQIMVDGHIYGAHRLAWLCATGSWPTRFIDHINGDPLDNRFSNLREATASENNRNSKRRLNNSSGYKGVCWHKQRERWRARIWIEGRRKSLGLFDSAEAAHSAYVTAAKEHHGEFARTK